MDPHIPLPKLAGAGRSWPPFRIKFLAYAEAHGFRNLLDVDPATDLSAHTSQLGKHNNKTVNATIMNCISDELELRLEARGWDLETPASETWRKLCELLEQGIHTTEEHNRTKQQARFAFSAHKGKLTSPRAFLDKFEAEFEKLKGRTTNQNIGLLWFEGLCLGMQKFKSWTFEQWYENYPQWVLEGSICEPCFARFHNDTDEVLEMVCQENEEKVKKEDKEEQAD